MSDTTELTAPEASVVLSVPRSPISVQPVGDDTDKPLADRRIRLDFGSVSMFVRQSDAKLLAGELIAAAVRIEWEHDFADAVPDALVADVLGHSLRVAPDAA